MTKNITIKNYYFYYFFYYGSIGCLMPLLNLYLKTELNFTNTQVGMIASIVTFVAIFNQPLWGMLTDYTKKPKLIVLILLIGTVTTGSLFVFQRSFTWAFVHYFIFAIFYSAINPLTDAMTSYHVINHPTSSYGHVRSFGSLGYAFFALGVGYITNWTSLRSLFLIYGVVGVFAIFWATKLEEHTEAKPKNFKADLLQLSKNKGYLYLILVMALVAGVQFGSFPYITLYLSTLNLKLSSMGWVFFIMAGAEVPIMIKSNVLIKAIGPKRLLMIVAFLSGLRQIIMSLNLSEEVMLLVVVSRAISIGIMVPTMIVYLQRIVKPNVFTTGVSLYAGISIGLFGWLFTNINGYLLDHTSFPFMYRTMGVITLLGFVLSWFLKSPRR